MSNYTHNLSEYCCVQVISMFFHSDIPAFFGELVKCRRIRSITLGCFLSVWTLNTLRMWIMNWCFVLALIIFRAKWIRNWSLLLYFRLVAAKVQIPWGRIV